MRICRITVLHGAVAGTALCMVLFITGSRRPSPSAVQEVRIASGWYGRTLGDDVTIAELPEQRRVWLYSLIGTDFPGAAALLRHWLRHYQDLGFGSEQMLLVLHSSNNGTTAAGNLAHVIGMLHHEGIHCERWVGTPYSSDAHLEYDNLACIDCASPLAGQDDQIKLRLLNSRVTSPQDWIVIADSDELYDFDALGPGIQGYVSRLEAAGASFGAGFLVDRVAEDGSLPDVQASPSLSDQFGLHCAVVRRLTRGFPWKVVAHKAYLRTNTGNHRAVTARTAARYFGPALPGERSPRGGFHGAADLYSLTPYAAHPESYVRTKQQLPAAGGLWRAALYHTAIAAMHFKWHSGVIPSATERLHYYRGNGSEQTPRYEHFVESERILARLKKNGSLPIKSAGCMKEMPWRVRSPPIKKPMFI